MTRNHPARTAPIRRKQRSYHRRRNRLLRGVRKRKAASQPIGARETSPDLKRAAEKYRKGKMGVTRNHLISKRKGKGMIERKGMKRKGKRKGKRKRDGIRIRKTPTGKKRIRRHPMANAAGRGLLPTRANTPPLHSHNSHNIHNNHNHNHRPNPQKRNHLTHPHQNNHTNHNNRNLLLKYNHNTPTLHLPRNPQNQHNQCNNNNKSNRLMAKCPGYPSPLALWATAKDRLSPLCDWKV